MTNDFLIFTKAVRKIPIAKFVSLLGDGNEAKIGGLVLKGGSYKGGGSPSLTGQITSVVTPKRAALGSSEACFRSYLLMFLLEHRRFSPSHIRSASKFSIFLRICRIFVQICLK